MDRHLDKIITELADKYNLSKFEVELIVKSQFQIVRDVIADDPHESIQLIHLGKFQISEKRISNLKNKKDED